MNVRTKELHGINRPQVTTPIYSIPLKVRDYECDMQGIVNNTVYMHYLEHARHEFLDSIGLNWKHLIDRGIYLVAVRAEIDYKKTLISGQKFTVTCKMAQETKLKIKFIQEILNEEQQSVLAGVTIAAFIDKEKKPILVEKIIERPLFL